MMFLRNLFKSIGLLIFGIILLSPLISQAYFALGVSSISFMNNGLVGNWTMDTSDVNFSTMKMSDRSGNGNNGQFNNMSTTTLGIAGFIGSAVRFPGTINYYMRVPNSSLYNFATTDNFSISLWIKPDATQSATFSANAIVEKFGLSGYPFTIRWNNQTAGADANKVSFGRYDGSNFPIYKTAAMSPNKWHHIVARKSGGTGGTMDIFVDGVLSGTGTDTTTGTTANSFDFGVGDRQDDASGVPFRGGIDDLRIFNRALTSTEINQLYHVGQTTIGVSPTTFLNNGLVGNWTMDASKMDYSTMKLTDSSGNGNTGQLVAMSTTTSFVAGKVGGAMTFNGSTQYVSTNFNASYPNTTFTISSWFKSTENSIFQVIAANGGVNDGWDLALSSGAVRVLIKNTTGSGARDQATVNSSFADGKWHNAVAVISTDTSSNGGNTIAIFVDGVSQSLGSDNGTGVVYTAGSETFGIGVRRLSSPTSFFEGSLDDIRIFNRTLSATEVSQLYNSGTTKVGVSNPAFLNSGLVGNWTMDAQDITYTTMKITDRSGNGNIGQLVAMSTTTSGVAGKTGSALKFNGGSAHIVVPYSASYDFSGSNTYTISHWIKTTKGNVYILSNQHGCISSGYSTWITGSGKVWITNCAQWARETAGTVIDGKWHHVVVTNDGSGTVGGYKIYIDGVSQSLTTIASFSNPSASGLSLDIGYNYGSYDYVGSIDQVRIYNRALSSEEILQLHKAGL